jgi:hypothetical protein
MDCLIELSGPEELQWQNSPKGTKESILQICCVHYKNNVNKVSQMAKVIPPKERGYFKNA